MEQARPAAVYSALSDEPGIARTMMASVQQRIAFGERARLHVCWIVLGLAMPGASCTYEPLLCLY